MQYGLVWCKSWLGREFLKITLSDLDRDVDVREIRQLIDDESDGSRSVPEKDIEDVQLIKEHRTK
jgi:hypothetical protein